MPFKLLADRKTRNILTPLFPDFKYRGTPVEICSMCYIALLMSIDEDTDTCQYLKNN